MTGKTNWTVLTGILFVVALYFEDLLIRSIWILYYPLILIIALSFTLNFIKALIKKRKLNIVFGLIIIVLTISKELFSSELFKSKKIIEATLATDLGSFKLTLRENQSYEITTESIFPFPTDQPITGRYKLNNNQIILSPINQINFIPDTLYIFQNKLIFQYNSEGQPDTSLGNFLRINK